MKNNAGYSNLLQMKRNKNIMNNAKVMKDVNIKQISYFLVFIITVVMVIDFLVAKYKFVSAFYTYIHLNITNKIFQPIYIYIYINIYIYI